MFKLEDRQTKPRDSTDKEVSSADFVHRITFQNYVQVVSLESTADEVSFKWS